jgi:hypothetical protein
MSTPLFDNLFPDPPLRSHQPLSGEQLRDFGIEDALQRAIRVKNDYVEKCLEAIKSFPRGAMITSEDVRDRAGDPPSAIDKSIMAGILKRAASRQYGLITITKETRPAKRSSVHAKDLAIWRKL